MVEYVGPIQHKRGTSAQWTASTIPLRDGELGIDTTTRRMKVGDGSTLWAGLPWVSPDQGTLEQLQALAAAVEDAVTPTDAVMAAAITTPGTATKTALSATIGGIAVVPVTHGSNPDYARPTGAAMVIWTGTVQPNNMAGADIFVSPAPIEPPAEFVPSEILSDWHNYFWAEDLTAADNAALSTLLDGSGNGRGFTDYDADTTRRPTMRVAESQLNGKKAVIFDGVNDVMKTNTFTAVSQPWSVALIGYAQNTGALASFFDAENGTTSRGRHQRDASNIHNLFAGTSLTGATAQKFLMLAEFDGATSRLIINGTEYAGSTGTVADITRLYIGARRDATWPAPLRLSFLGLVSREFTSLEIADMEARAAQTYGVSIA